MMGIFNKNTAIPVHIAITGKLDEKTEYLKSVLVNNLITGDLNNQAYQGDFINETITLPNEKEMSVTLSWNTSSGGAATDRNLFTDANIVLITYTKFDLKKINESYTDIQKVLNKSHKVVLVNLIQNTKFNDDTGDHGAVLAQAFATSKGWGHSDFKLDDKSIQDEFTQCIEPNLPSSINNKKTVTETVISSIVKKSNAPQNK